MVRGLGCLVLMFVVVWLGLEVLAYIGVSRFLNSQFEKSVNSGGYLIVIVWMVVSLVIAIKLGRRHVGQVAPGILNGTAGKHVVGVLGAILLGLPGLLSDVPGILLLLPPVQSLFGKLGSAVMAVVVKRSMGKMMSGGFPAGGFPGAGFPGGIFPNKGSPFPGMKPLVPDDKVRLGKPGKTYDTTIEKD